MNRPNRSLDIERPDQLLAYLRDSGRIDRAESPTIRVLVGGVSNRTVLVERSSGEGWVLKQALAKLRVKAEWFSDPIRVEREALGLQWLEQLAPNGCITPLIFQDRRHHLLAMAAVPQPHDNWKTLLLAGDVRRQHVQAFGALLGTIHANSRTRAAELEPVFRDQQFFESLRLEPYYLYSGSQVPAAAPFLNELVAQTRRRRFCLVHGDYSPKNILVHKERLVLLDHEVIHWGDGAFDLGFALAHLLSKAHHLRAQQSQLAEAALVFWQSYVDAAESRLPTDFETFVVRHGLGCLLARVAGRSTLEYFDQTQRDRQCKVVVAMMHTPADSVDRLIEDFIRSI